MVCILDLDTGLAAEVVHHFEVHTNTGGFGFVYKVTLQYQCADTQTVLIFGGCLQKNTGNV